MLEDNATHFLVEIMKVPEILAHVNQEIMRDEEKKALSYSYLSFAENSSQLFGV